MKRFLVPVDFSPCSRAALDHALALAKQVDASVDVLHVMEAPRYVMPDMIVHAQGSTPTPLNLFVREYVGREMEELLNAKRSPEGPKIGARVEAGEPFQTIVKVADEDGYDMLVMGTHGRTGMAHLLIGSVTESVIRACRCPVLAIKAPA